MNHFKYIVGGLSFLTLFGLGFAANPSYNFLPASGSQLKLHCNYTMNLSLLAGGQNYNAFESTISFDPSNVFVTHGTINSPFTQSQVYTLVSNLYRTMGALPGGQKSSLDVNAISFGFRTLNNISSSTLSFTDRLGNPVTFGPATTADASTLNGFDVGGDDILAGVYGATYSFVPYPCVPDVTSPMFTSQIPSNGARYIPSNQIVSFLTYDWAGAGSVSGPSPLASNNRSHYWYQGLSTGNLANYVDAPDTVDNQEGVNSATIKATVSCPTCSSFGGPYTLSGSDLNVVGWNGDGSRNQWTWNSQRRGYTVSFNAPAAYEVEKQVNVSLEAVDNPNENLQTHIGTMPFSFNAPVNPTISRVLPATNTFVSPSKASAIRLSVQDDWAGIDTGTLKITIPTIMSGSEQLLTGYTYSGSELQFILSGGALGLGNSGKYVVDFYPLWDFPANSAITITGTVLDLAGNQGSFGTSFTTRPDCSYFGCNEILNINIMEGVNLGNYTFTGTILVVTGTNPNSPYPYLTGVNNNVLVCGYPWTGAVLTGNVPIYNPSNAQINGTAYTGKSLYITGLNFILVDGVVVVQ